MFTITYSYNKGSYYSLFPFVGAYLWSFSGHFYYYNDIVKRAKQVHPVWMCIGKWALLTAHWAWKMSTAHWALENEHCSLSIHTIREIPARVPPSLLAGCRAIEGPECGAKFKIRPIRAHYSPLQPLQMVAGHLNVPTLCRKNIQMFRWNSVRKTA